MAERTLTDCERELREVQDHYARALNALGAPREDGTMDGDRLEPLRRRITEDAGLPPAVLGTDPLEGHPGLVWRERPVVQEWIPTMRGYTPVYGSMERKPDLNLKALARCVDRDALANARRVLGIEEEGV